MKVFAVKDTFLGDAENPASYRLYGNTVILLFTPLTRGILLLNYVDHRERVEKSRQCLLRTGLEFLYSSYCVAQPEILISW